ncbi:hypothetical protein [Microbacterium aurantiacum]|uniref:hypothetical protein n=1 Tax=Microbacterium aurantiacum TaxID=162393 RepID=UPI003D724670
MITHTRTAGETIRAQVRERYGIDVDTPGADRAAVAAALEEAERDRAQARVERERSGEELTASQILFQNADRHEREAQQTAERDQAGGGFTDLESRAERDDAGWDYDSSERRRQFAASLEGTADQKVIDARILADGENATHPREAVRTQPGRSAKPRRKTQSTGQQRTRGGLAR